MEKRANQMARLIGLIALFILPVYYLADLVGVALRHASIQSELVWCLWIPPYTAASIAWYQNADRFPFVSKVLVVATALYMLGSTLSTA